MLRRLYAFHAKCPGVLNAKELYTLIRASMFIPREKLNKLLSSLLKIIEKGMQPAAEDRIRLIISGTLLEPLDILDYLEEGGAVVVGDDFKNGLRYINDDADENSMPLEALVDRQLKRMPFAAYDTVRNKRRFFLAKMAQEKEADGVILLHLKYCEPENFDYYDNIKTLREAGLPAMRIETEFGTTSLGQMRTRVQAFLEMLGGEFYD